MRKPVALLPMLIAGLLLLNGCATPPSSSYERTGSGVERPGAQQALGNNAAGEACTQDATVGARSVDVFCGTWRQPSAHVEAGGPATQADLMPAATTGAWRSAIDGRLQCEAPIGTTILSGRPALLLQCVRRVGGWPQVAIVAVVDGTLWRGDGVLPAAPVLEQAIGVLTGVVRAGAAPLGSAADGLLATRLAARAFRSGDVGQFEQLITAGTRANLAADPADAETAFRAALALQQKALGRDDPNTVGALLPLAVQLSNQGRYVEAETSFAEAARLVPRSADDTAPARLLHYLALHARNQQRFDAALSLLIRAEAGYTRWIPADALQARPDPGIIANRFGNSGGSAMPRVTPSPEMVADPRAELALVGLIEARRNRALVLRSLGRAAEGEAVVRSAIDLAEGNGIARPLLSGRLYRTVGALAASSGAADTALSQFAHSSYRFELSLPGSRTLAETDLLRAGQLQSAGRSDAAVTACRSAVHALAALKVASTPTLIGPCLDAYAATADAQPEQRQTLLDEMFTAAQLAQGSITSEQIAQATARLRESARDPRVAGAIRAWQDDGDALALLYRERDAARAAQAIGRPVPNGADAAGLDKRIADAQAALADADSALQAASPGFGQLVQQVVPAADVLATMQPNEAFAAITLGEASGWVFLLRPQAEAANGGAAISVARIDLSARQVAALTQRVRGGIELTATGLPRFDVAASRDLYSATLGRVAPAFAGAGTLVIAPTGPLLSLPFAVLLTGPADVADLGAAPWLVRDLALAHVPSPANFVSLRKAGRSHGNHPWFGFGGFRPVTLAQAQATFPAAACADSAKLFAMLPPLPSAARELDAARRLLGAATSDEILDAAFTAEAVRRASLKDYRILHFATHALLPAELQCQNEPAIVTSAPAGARDASGTLLTAGNIVGLDLDADLVVLSACNSGGSGGTTAGESLSGLARAFFFAGARALLVTHWSVNDQAAAFLVVDTLRRLKVKPGVAAAMRGAELGMLAAAGHGLPPELAHPFFWAPFAVIDDGNHADLPHNAESADPGPARS